MSIAMPAVLALSFLMVGIMSLSVAVAVAEAWRECGREASRRERMEGYGWNEDIGFLR